jgi:hypothetical protein
MFSVMKNRCSFCDEDFNSFKGFIPTIGEVCKICYDQLVSEINKKQLIESKKIVAITYY